MTSALKFREAIYEDVPFLNELIREGKAYWGYSEDGLDRFMQSFGIPDTSHLDKGFGFVAELPSEVVGYYFFKAYENPPELDHFFLNTKYIGQGYGRILWEHCVQKAKQKDWKEFVFWSDPHAQAFYEHMGAFKIKEHPM